MSATAPALRILDSEKDALLRIVENNNNKRRIINKCRAILLAGDGRSNTAIAAQTGMSRPTVIALRTAFGIRGISAILEPAHRRRKKTVLTEEMERRILEATRNTSPIEGVARWTVRTMAAHLGVSRMAVQRTWKKFAVHTDQVTAASNAA